MELRPRAHHFRQFAVVLIFIGSLVCPIECQVKNDNSAFPSPPPESVTQNPSELRTGKLKQFSGFFTPRPLPANANFVYASIWASWSAWSFCANNVQIRVRACNTVRGFTCPGPNQERKPCAQGFDRAPARQRIRPSTDYDAVDPWEEDRREALRQLYSDYSPPETEGRPKVVPNFGFKKPVKVPGTDFVAVQRSGGKTQNFVGGYGAGVGAPIPPPRDESYRNRQHSDGEGHAPSMTPELLFGSKLEIPLKAISNIKSKERTEVDSARSQESSTEDAPEKVVLSKEQSESPLKVGMKSEEKTVNSGTAAPLTEELESLSREESETLKTSKITSSPISSSESERKEPSGTTENVPKVQIPDDDSDLEKVPESVSEPEAEMYDDEFEKKHDSTTKSPTEELKELEANIEELEKETEKYDDSKLHSGEVVFNKDTEKALEWLIANMTKATEIALAETKKTSLLEVDNQDRTNLHSGEVLFDKLEHSENKVQIDENKIVRRLHGAKTRVVLPKPQRIDAAKYDQAKVDKSLFPQFNHHKETPKTFWTEPEDVAEPVQIPETTTGGFWRGFEEPKEIVQVPERVAPSQNMKALDLDLVPKAPKIPSGPLPSVLSSGESTGQVFLIDAPLKEKEAKWSDWGDWNECFCDKQVRTRVCIYDSGYHSQGCSGRSYESRPCVATRPCPAKIAAAKRLQATTSSSPLGSTDSDGLYTLAPPKGPRTGYAFKPHPLSAAISRIQTFRL